MDIDVVRSYLQANVIKEKGSLKNREQYKPISQRQAALALQRE